MPEHNQRLRVALLNIQLLQQAAYALLDDGFDILCLQELPWTPWRVQVKDFEPTPNEPITIFDR
jgi:hypothetical protein